jgi:hypothetical protein
MLTMQEKIAKDRLDYLLARAKDPSTASNKLDKQIQDTQKELRDLSQKRLPLMREETKLVAEIGPIKYVAELFYDEGDDSVAKAVRLVIMIIMFAFDPLAVLLLIAANLTPKKVAEIPSVLGDIFEVPKENVYQVVEDTHHVDTQRH